MWYYIKYHSRSINILLMFRLNYNSHVNEIYINFDMLRKAINVLPYDVEMNITVAHTSYLSCEINVFH